MAGISVALIWAPPALSAAPAVTSKCSVEQGQAYIDEGRFEHAVREFTCVIQDDPTAAEGYRGKVEAELMQGRFADAIATYTRFNALVLPAAPGAESDINAAYAARLAVDPDDVVALTGASFAHWWFFEYAPGIHLLNRLLDLEPDNLFANLFGGSSRLLGGGNKARGEAELAHAIQLAPTSGDVRFIVADAYTYGIPDPARAFVEASLALGWGLDIPRIHAILAAAYKALGDPQAAAEHIKIHIDMVTTELVTTPTLPIGSSFALPAVPGRTFQIPIAVAAGQKISLATGGPDGIWDTILVLLAPNGSLLLGSDDEKSYLASFEWVAPAAGFYWVQVTSFEAVSTGTLVVSLK